jgi:hypothetical protein
MQEELTCPLLIKYRGILSNKSVKNNVKQLLADIAEKCSKHGINFRLEYATCVDAQNLPCSGYFDEESLVVATKKKDQNEWISTLLHEACHLDQFLKGPSVWTPDDQALHIVEAWIDGKKMTKQKRNKGFKNALALELDCEKRTIQKIKKYKLDIDIKDYIKKANSYLFAYTHALHERHWYKQPYENKKIYSKMPDKFLKLDQYFTEYFKYENLYK